MHDYTRLEAAILTTLRDGIADLRGRDETLAVVACGLVEDLTGFFIAGAGTQWLLALEGDDATMAWAPSEWPLYPEEDNDSVTSAIWELSGTQAASEGTGEELDDAQYAALRIAYVERILAALLQLQAEGELVDANGRELWVWLHSADGTDDTLDNLTFAALQPEDIAAEFAQRYDGGTAQLFALLAQRGGN